MVMQRTAFGIVYVCAKTGQAVMTTFRSRRGNFHWLTDLPAYTHHNRGSPVLRLYRHSRDYEARACDNVLLRHKASLEIYSYR